jgi:cytochrome c oxidase subunit 2
MAGCAAMFVVAPMAGVWLPMAVSSHAWDIDFLFYVILGVTGFFFILTEALLVAFMYRYTGGDAGVGWAPSVLWSIFKPLANVFNSAHKVEMAWTVVPSLILLYVAFAQVDTWQDVKYKSRLDQDVLAKTKEMPLQIEVSARQFEWRMRYPSVATWKEWKKDPSREKSTRWIKNRQFDDVLDIPNELHVIKNRHVVVQLSTKDVIHSFNSAHMRIKQDALPGKIIPVWFKPIESNVIKAKDKDGNFIKDKDGYYIWQDGRGRDLETGQPLHPEYVWDIACAELCGWGHYRMVGKIFVHPDEEDFLAWLETAAARERAVGHQ